MFFIRPEDFTAEKLTARNEVINARIEMCKVKIEEGALSPFCSYELEIQLLKEEYQLNSETISKLEQRDRKISELFTNINLSGTDSSQLLTNLKQQIEHFKMEG
ncbi:hypothetical protein [Lysinibacillus fusiformis]|uniref:hypothetical protein n=1 Tax=Lysinibacillus fusiformis TaxID=28031 RepID=UPI003AAC19C7